MIRPLTLALLFALAPMTADAGWRTRDGVMLEDTPSQQSERGFGAMLQIATEAESKRFHEEWYSTATDHSPKLQTIDSARRGETVSILVLYAGCALDDASQDDIATGKAPCGAQLRLRVVAPDGAESRRNWRADLVAKLATLQDADGSFRSVDDRWLEDNKVLITAYALRALQHAAR